jgi:hypothetical protein
LDFTEARGDRLAFPPAMTAALVALTARRADLAYDPLWRRAPGVAFVVAGAVGLLTPVDERLLVSVLAVVLAACYVLGAMTAKRRSARRAALLGNPYRDHVAAEWLVPLLVVMATVELTFRTTDGAAVGVATIVCAVLVAVLGAQATVFSGEDVVLEAAVDRRFRTGQVLTAALYAILPSLIWVIAGVSTPFAIKLLVELLMLSVVIYVSTAPERADRDLTRIVDRVVAVDGTF